MVGVGEREGFGDDEDDREQRFGNGRRNYAVIGPEDAVGFAGSSRVGHSRSSIIAGGSDPAPGIIELPRFRAYVRSGSRQLAAVYLDWIATVRCRAT